MLASLATFIVAFTMGGLNYVTTVLQARCRGMTMMRMPLSVWGIFMATVLGLLAFPALFVSAIMMTLDCLAGNQLLHAGGLFDGSTAGVQRRQPAVVPALVLVFRSSGSLHRRAAGIRHRVRSAQHACAATYIRLSHDGLGDSGDRLSQFRGVGAPHVRERQ